MEKYVLAERKLTRTQKFRKHAVLLNPYTHPYLYGVYLAIEMERGRPKTLAEIWQRMFPLLPDKVSRAITKKQKVLLAVRRLLREGIIRKV